MKVWRFFFGEKDEIKGAVTKRNVPELKQEEISEVYPEELKQSEGRPFPAECIRRTQVSTQCFLSLPVLLSAAFAALGAANDGAESFNKYFSEGYALGYSNATESGTYGNPYSKSSQFDMMQGLCGAFQGLGGLGSATLAGFGGYLLMTAKNSTQVYDALCWIIVGMGISAATFSGSLIEQTGIPKKDGGYEGYEMGWCEGAPKALGCPVYHTTREVAEWSPLMEAVTGLIVGGAATGSGALLGLIAAIATGEGFVGKRIGAIRNALSSCCLRLIGGCDSRPSLGGDLGVPLMTTRKAPSIQNQYR